MDEHARAISELSQTIRFLNLQLSDERERADRYRRIAEGHQEDYLRVAEDTPPYGKKTDKEHPDKRATG